MQLLAQRESDQSQEQKHEEMKALEDLRIRLKAGVKEAIHGLQDG